MPRRNKTKPVICGFSVNPGEAWAITPSALRRLLSLSLSNYIDDETDDDENTDILKDYNDYGYAELSITGPIMRYPSLFSRLFGGTSVEEAMNALDEAAAKPEIRGVLLNINSPGGTVDGINELSGKISGFGKPVIAYVGGEANSAAYWLASAADKIIVNDTAAVGSIGVYTSYLDSRRAMKDAGYDQYDIIASQSPRKVPDPAQDEGKAQIQSHIDKLADIFIRAVAENRGTTVDNVMENYGRGDVVIGAEAVRLGMADGIGNYDAAENMLLLTMAAHRKTNTGRTLIRNKSDNTGGKAMTKDQILTEYPEAARALMEDGAVAERARIKSIEDIGGDIFQDIVSNAKWDGKTTAEGAAVLILKAKKEKDASEAEQNRKKTDALKAARAQDAGIIPSAPLETAPDEAQAFQSEVEKMKAAAKKVSGSRRRGITSKGGLTNE